MPLNDYQRGSLAKHEDIKARILSHPEVVGVNKSDVIKVETEFALTKKKHAIARPDIVISYRCSKGVCRKYVEIKSGSCRRAKENLRWQLWKIHNYLRFRKMQGDVVGVYPLAGELVVLAG